MITTNSSEIRDALLNMAAGFPLEADLTHEKRFDEALQNFDRHLSTALVHGNTEIVEDILVYQLFIAALKDDIETTREIRIMRLEFFWKFGKRSKAYKEWESLQPYCCDAQLAEIAALTGFEPPPDGYLQKPNATVIYSVDSFLYSGLRVDNEEYFKCKQAFIKENFNIREYAALEYVPAGAKLDCKPIIPISAVNRASKIIIALAWTDILGDLVKHLISLGVARENIVLLMNRPDRHKLEQDAIEPYYKFEILPGGEICCEINGIRLMLLSWREARSVHEVLHTKCYDFFTPRKNIVVADIGMNVGSASLFFAQKESVSHVYAYEPFHETYARALKSFEHNPRIGHKITPKNFGLGNCDKELAINYNPESKGEMSTVIERFGYLQELHKTTVQIKDAGEEFESLLAAHPGSAFVFKVDCEGGEYEILERLAEKKLLHKISILVMEWHNLGGRKVHELYPLLNDNGFVFRSQVHPPGNTGHIFAVNQGGEHADR